MSPTRRSLLKQASLASFSLWLPTVSSAATALRLPRSTPESQGVSARGILDFLAAVEREKLELHSLMILRHGKVVAEGWWDPYGPDLVHTMYSMSKSFTSTAVGFAVAEKRLNVEDKVISFFPDKLPEKVSENLAAMRVKDLLTMSTGNEKEPTQVCVKSEDWVSTFLAQNIAHKPGTQFMYNSAATYMCSAIVQKLTGQTILDYLTPRLFEPLGVSGMRWETCPRGINTGGWGLSIQTEGLAKFGQLLLQKGQWQDRQLLPASWIEEATRFHIQQTGGDKPDRPKAKNDWLQGYGYQFWRCQGTAFRGDGAFGQFTLVLPEQDAVIVMTSENKNMQGQLDLVWQHLLPALTSPMPTDADLGVLKTLRLQPPKSTAVPAAAFIGGFKLEPNEFGLKKVTLGLGDNSLVFEADGHRIECGLKGWRLGETSIPITPPRLISGGRPKPGTVFKVAAAAAWKDEQTLLLTWRYYETPHSDTLTCRLDAGGLTIHFLDSITAMNPKGVDRRPALRGRPA